VVLVFLFLNYFIIFSSLFFQAHFFTNMLTFSEWTNLVAPKILAIPGKSHQIYILNFDLRPFFCRNLRLFRRKKNGRRTLFLAWFQTHGLLSKMCHQNSVIRDKKLTKKQCDSRHNLLSKHKNHLKWVQFGALNTLF